MNLKNQLVFQQLELENIVQVGLELSHLRSFNCALGGVI